MPVSGIPSRAATIRVASKANVITGNDATGNTLVMAPPTAFDLTDRNLEPPCDANSWSANAYGSRSPDCIN